MPDTEPMPISKRAPISTRPTTEQVRRWGECLALYEQIQDKIFALQLQHETLTAKALYASYASQNQFTLNLIGADTTEKRFFLLKENMIGVQTAIQKVQSLEYGLKWRDGDFDILSPSPAMGALFIPLIVGGLILAGCFATLYHMGKNSDELLVDYQKLNKAADTALCKDPSSDLCKGWQVVKENQKIEEKESFADTLKGGLSKGLTVALALLGGSFALSFLRK
ncbi:MAG: hypothetical protein PHO67_08785 [Candidatus Omnitrophica bacterium]|nr:hypothetical protein [Candidatus Omnitrophota bacterium]